MTIYLICYSRFKGATCTVFNLSHGRSKEQKNEQENNDPNPQNNAAAGYHNPVKTELLKGGGILDLTAFCLWLFVKAYTES